jgi:hypothetical protein
MKANRERLRLVLLRAFRALSAPFHPHQPPALPAAPRILLIRPDHLGDLLFATPALRVLRTAFPDAHLACMVGSWGKAVLETNPHLDEIMTCEFPAFSRKPQTSLLDPYRVLAQWATALKPRRFDLAIVLRFDHWWGALLAYLAGIPRRLGHAISECQPFLTQAVPYRSGQHEVKQNLELVQQVMRDNGRPTLLCSSSSQCLWEIRILSLPGWPAVVLGQRNACSAFTQVQVHPSSCGEQRHLLRSQMRSLSVGVAVWSSLGVHKRSTLPGPSMRTCAPMLSSPLAIPHWVSLLPCSDAAAWSSALTAGRCT